MHAKVSLIACALEPSQWLQLKAPAPLWLLSKAPTTELLGNERDVHYAHAGHVREWKPSLSVASQAYGDFVSSTASVAHPQRSLHVRKTKLWVT